jgi:hypothetical protein
LVVPEKIAPESVWVNDSAMLPGGSGKRSHCACVKLGTTQSIPKSSTAFISTSDDTVQTLGADRFVRNGRA